MLAPAYPVREIGDLGPGHHLCFLYETEDEHRSFITPFLRQELERGEEVVYLYDSHSGDAILNYLRSDGFEAEPALSSIQLSFLAAAPTYGQAGSIEVNRAMDFLRA